MLWLVILVTSSDLSINASWTKFEAIQWMPKLRRNSRLICQIRYSKSSNVIRRSYRTSLNPSLKKSSILFKKNIQQKGNFNFVLNWDSKKKKLGERKMCAKEMLTSSLEHQHQTTKPCERLDSKKKKNLPVNYVLTVEMSALVVKRVSKVSRPTSEFFFGTLLFILINGGMRN